MAVACLTIPLSLRWRYAALFLFIEYSLQTNEYELDKQRFICSRQFWLFMWMTLNRISVPLCAILLMNRNWNMCISKKKWFHNIWESCIFCKISFLIWIFGIPHNELEFRVQKILPRIKMPYLWLQLSIIHIHQTTGRQANLLDI